MTRVETRVAPASRANVSVVCDVASLKNTAGKLVGIDERVGLVPRSDSGQSLSGACKSPASFI